MNSRAALHGFETEGFETEGFEAEGLEEEALDEGEPPNASGESELEVDAGRAKVDRSSRFKTSSIVASNTSVTIKAVEKRPRKRAMK
jgi:hypothetical protein